MKSIRTKLIMYMLLLSLVPVIIVGMISYSISSKEMKTLSLQSLKQATNQNYDLLEQVQKELENEMRGYINLAVGNMKSSGTLRLDSKQNMAAGSYNLPQMTDGNTVINDSIEFVDNIRKLTKGYSTVYEFYNNEFISISSNVLNDKNERDIGTSIKNDNPVYQALMNGDQYFGRENLLGDMYNVAYMTLKDSTGNVIGAVFAAKPELTDELAAKIRYQVVGEKGYVYVMNSSGSTVIHKNGKIDFSNNDFVKKILKEKNGTVEYVLDGQKMTANFKYLQKYDWYIVSNIGTDELYNKTNLLLKNTMIMGIICIIAAILLGLWIANGFVKPIRAFSKTFTAMKEGDLTQKLNIKSKDEIGQLALSFNQMGENLKTLLVDIQHSADVVASSSKELSAATEESNKTMEEIAKGVTNIAYSTQGNSASIQEAASGIEKVTNSIQMVALSSGEVADLSKEVENAAIDGAKSVREVANSIHFVSDSSKNVMCLIDELNDATKQIGNIVEIIKSISDQTNMLALNAAIEAARAGEAGRGFSVVADEVRKLAEQSKVSSEEISALILSAQKKTGDVIAAVEQSDQMVMNSVSGAGEAHKKMDNILNSIQKINIKISDVSTNTVQQAETAQQMTKVMEEVAETIAATASNTEGMSAGVEEQVSTFEEISATAQLMYNMAERLKERINFFKV